MTTIPKTSIEILESHLENQGYFGDHILPNYLVETLKISEDEAWEKAEEMTSGEVPNEEEMNKFWCWYEEKHYLPSLTEKNCHTKNSLTWQAYAVMRTNLECLKMGQFPNGQKLSKDDIEKINLEIEGCTEILNEHNCELPVTTLEKGDQLTLF